MGTNESKSKSNPNFMINLALFGQYSFEYHRSNIALPVHQIMAQLQEGVDAKGAQAEEKGDKAMDDEAEKMIAEAEDRVTKS